ncbi:MAG: aminoacyl-tRNA hydrolase [Syntrophomonadaceae bacterium]|nr:aminoacyl-tRNA hydrolase [Syntrophomonadaceae bacterium]
MKIIVGLGNPGPEYKNTRHNIGYMVLEELAARYPVEKQDAKFDALIGQIRIGGEKVLLVKPLTYMNLSGRAVQPLVHWHKLDLQDLIVVYDDMDLPLGRLRIRAGGGSGGHKGIKSIIERLGTSDFARIRLGIGWAVDRDAVDWVLGRFGTEEEDEARHAVERAADALEKWVTAGLESTMNTYN